MAGWNFGEWRLGKRSGEWIARRAKPGGGWERHRLGVKIRNGKSSGQTALVAFVTAREAANGIQAEPTLQEIFESYAADRERDGISTVNIWGNWKNLKPVFAPLTLSTVSADVCRDYAEMRDKAGRSRATIWTELQRLRTSVNWYCKAKRIVAPVIWVPSKGKGRSRVITMDEAGRLLAGARADHIKLFIVLAIATGARRGAILDLTWDRIDFQSSEIRLDAEAAPAFITDRSWRKGRPVVPMNGMARAALQTACLEATTHTEGDYVVSVDGSRIQNIKTGFYAAVARAGLENVSPHTIRHSVASWLRNDGVDMQQISQLLGHAQQSITETIYAHPSADGTRAAAERLNLKIAR